MGFVTTGKALTADHPFFLSTSKPDEADSEPGPAVFKARQNEDSDSDSDDDHEEDEHFEDDGGDYHREDSASDGEEYDEKDNVFFEAQEFVEETQDE